MNKAHLNMLWSVSDPGEFPTFEESFSGELPCSLFYLDNAYLKQFKTFDHLTQHMLQSEQSGPSASPLNKDLTAKLSSQPLQQTIHLSTLGQYLRHLYENDDLMDVQIEVEGNIFVAHRVALSCFSNYFSELLLAQSTTTVPVEVKLLGISAKAFAAFLEFVYTGEMSVNADIAGDLLVISEFLDVKELKNRLNMIACNLPLAQAVKIVANCRRGSSNQLYEMLMVQILHNFIEASKIKMFMDIDLETFCALLASGGSLILLSVCSCL